MNILQVAIILFCIMELGNVLILYFTPDLKIGNGVAILDSWRDAKENEYMELFTRYMAYWVAGVKLIFIVLLLVVLFTGTETTQIWAVVAMILSIATYFWKLHPIIKKLDVMGKISPKGYSKTLGRMITGFLVMFSIALIAFFTINYLTEYYPADNTALAIMNNSEFLQVDGNITILTPSSPTETALIFYPGAKVENTAYLPILQKLMQKGISCVLVKMPFNLAFFDKNAADDVYEKLPNIKRWYIGGHSLGGAMASDYAARNKDTISGLILLGSYIYGDYPAQDALTIYGTLNANLAKNITYNENIVVIEGGNHAQFGNYGRQKGDPDATITDEEQQNIAVIAILEFMKIKGEMK